MENELRPFWRPFFNFNWKFGLFLILTICIPRFLLVLNANETANYGYIGLIMTFSAIVPFVFLNKYGRKSIGIKKSSKYRSILLAFLYGLVISVFLGYLGSLIYGYSIDNWYVYISQSYNIPIGISSNDKFIMFSIMAITGMIFSPIGEELFFRGIVHSSFAKSVGNKKASLIDSSVFALTHISHFGLVFTNNKWEFLTIPALIWVVGMFLLSIVLYLCRKRSDSLLGAIVCHSSFNLGMIYYIFYIL